MNIFKKFIEFLRNTFCNVKSVEITVEKCNCDDCKSCECKCDDCACDTKEEDQMPKLSEPVDITIVPTRLDYIIEEKPVAVEVKATPENVIVESAFEGSHDLKSYSVPAGVVEIGPKAFKNCVHLTKVTIPATVKSIGKQAFYGCTELKEVIIKGSGVVEVAAEAFCYRDGRTVKNLPNIEKFKVTKSALEMVKAHKSWKRYADLVNV